MQLAPSIHRLGSGLVNAYLVEEAGLVTIIDAGLPGYWSDLPGELAAMGRTVDDVRALVLTHGHSDHIGFAERMRRERGLVPCVHELDAALARGEVPNPAQGMGPVRALALIRFFAYGARRGALRTTTLGEVGVFADGTILDVPGAPRVIHVPGHTPGSAALHVAAAGALFVGDALATTAVTTGETGPRIAPFSADVTMALASLERLEGVDADLVLPGHGEPWRGGMPEAIRLIRATAAP